MNNRVVAGAAAAAAVVLGGALIFMRMTRKTDTDAMKSIHSSPAAVQTVQPGDESDREERAESSSSAPERAEGIAAEKSRAEQGGYELSMQTESLSDGVKLQYPVLSGMEDSAQQDKVNALLKSHVDSFVKAYPIDAAKDKLELSCRQNTLDRSRLGVIYSGLLNGKTKIFFADTVDLKTGESVYLKDFLQPETAAEYVLGKDLLFEEKNASESGEILNYLHSKDRSYYISLFSKQAFSGDPKTESFFYTMKGNIIFSVPLPEKLGASVLIRVEPETQ